MIRAAFFDIDGTLVSMRTHEIPASAVCLSRERKGRPSLQRYAVWRR